MACHNNGRLGCSHHQPCCCCCPPSCCQPNPHPASCSAPAAAANDPLLQAIAARLFQYPPTAPPQPAYHFYNPAYPVSQQQQKKYHSKYEEQVHQPQAHSVVESLLGRIAALESALARLSHAAPHGVAMADPPRNKPKPAPPAIPASLRLSMRDLAARTIQAHFRRYLVRRSQALRHLKHLAAVRSHVVAIKSSLSDQDRINLDALSRQLSDLFLQLDSIKSTDPSIREGKRSISRELVPLLELTDGLAIKRRELLGQPIQIVQRGNDPPSYPLPEEPNPGIEEPAGVSTINGEGDDEANAGNPGFHNLPLKPRRRVVNFVNFPNAERVPAAAGSQYADDIAEWGGSGHGSAHDSDEGRSPRIRQKPGSMHRVANGCLSGQNPSGRHLGLSAPTPVQMEPRRGETKSKNSVLL